MHKGFSPTDAALASVYVNPHQPGEPQANTSEGQDLK